MTNPVGAERVAKSFNDSGLVDVIETDGNSIVGVALGMAVVKRPGIELTLPPPEMVPVETTSDNDGGCPNACARTKIRTALDEIASVTVFTTSMNQWKKLERIKEEMVNELRKENC